MVKEWYCYIAGKVSGPFNVKQVRDMAKWGQLLPTDQLRRGEDGKWVQASTFKGLEFAGASRQPQPVVSAPASVASLPQAVESFAGLSSDPEEHNRQQVRDTTMHSLPGERVLYKLSSGSLVVTTHRVRYDKQGDGTWLIQSIMLEEVDSCVMMRQTYPVFLFFAALCGLVVCVYVGIQSQKAVAGLIFGVCVGLIFGIVYLMTRYQVIAIRSAGLSISLSTWGWTVEEVRELFDQVEAAKNARYLAFKATGGKLRSP